MNQCSSCAREIPETATVCDTCSQWAADVAAPAEFTAHAAAPAGGRSTTAALPAAINRRRVALLAGAGVAVLALGMLSARGAPESAVAGSSGASPATASPPDAGTAAEAAPTQSWSRENSAYWVANRRKSVAFELPAENTVPIWMRSVRPALIVRCMGQRTEVFVVTESAMKIEPQTEDHTVTFGFDGEAVVSERWPDSEEHDALFARDAVGFARRLIRARTLRFGYTPHNANPVVADFHVAGLGPLIEPAAKECGWTK